MSPKLKEKVISKDVKALNVPYYMTETGEIYNINDHTKVLCSDVEKLTGIRNIGVAIKNNDINLLLDEDSEDKRIIYKQKKLIQKYVRDHPRMQLKEVYITREAAGYFIDQEDNLYQVGFWDRECSLGTRLMIMYGDEYYKKGVIKIQENVDRLEFGRNCMYIVKKDGSVYAAGVVGILGETYFVGNGDEQSVKKLVDGVTYISAGHMNFALIREGDVLYTGGNDVFNNLGIGKQKWSYKNPLVRIMDDVQNVFIGEQILVAVKNDNSVWACGSIYNSENPDGFVKWLELRKLEKVSEIIQLKS